MATGQATLPAVTTTLAASAAQTQAGPLLNLSTYLRFYTLFHPHVCEMVRRLNAEGIAGLLDRDLQERSNDFVLNLGEGPVMTTLFELQTEYEPSEYVHHVYPKENVDFDGGAYSVYNWETFFHIPLLIGDRLSKDQQFQAAQKWLHFIFNPTVSSTIDPPMRYWNTLPFFQNTHPERQQIVALLMSLKSKGADPATKDQVRFQIEQWRDNPFKPHLIARLRITAYQKTVVMKYIDNLINWGDQLYRQETIESINEATQLYVLAYKILGPRPQEIPQRVKQDSSQTYAELRPRLDEFSNALVTLENEFPFASDEAGPSNDDGSLGGDGLGTAPQFYFCIPPNDKLLTYWDSVEDRLFKIRHCMNIEGVVRQLPLFEPPIDPALLVRATAMGLDLNSVLNDLSAPLSPYRFQTLVQKALELCGDLKALGGALLSALEKKDAEEIALLRADHEVALLKAMRDIKSGQIQEAQRAKAALQKSWDVVEARRTFYQVNLDSGLNFYEQDHLTRLQNANDKQAQALTYDLVAQGASQIPNATLGSSGWSSPVNVMQFGGTNLSLANSAYARHLGGQASDETYKANRSSIMGGHKRREDDWRQQVTLAEKEEAQIQSQIDASDVRIAIAEWDLRNHDTQVEQSAEVQEFFQNKYTQTELYSWMVGQISSVYFQTYKLAYDIAKQAERAYRFERGLKSSNLIQFGHWDSLRKGLLSGERLALNIKGMEAAYMAEHRREFEIVKSVSLAAVDPLALITLKETGRCDFELTEARFDFDFPGHYMRRIKAMSVTIPCVTGPYVGVNATLTLLSNRIRIDPNAQRSYTPDDFEDARFIFNFASQQSIATSHAQNDSGMFELNFRDERYLPFEGAGAVSRLRLDMPRACNAFDFNTISDVIVRISYTARDGGELLRAKAMEAALLPGEPVIPGVSLQQASPPVLNMPDQSAVTRFFSARQEFSNEWHRFLHPLDTATAHTLTLHIDSGRFPLPFQTKHIDLVAFEAFLKLKGGMEFNVELPFALGHIQENGEADDQSQFPDCSFSLSGSPVPGLAHASSFPNEAEPQPAPQPLGRWDIVVQEADLQSIAQPQNIDQPLVNTVLINGQTHTRLNPDAIYDLLVLCRYATSEPQA